MAQTFHPSMNAFSKATIFGGIFLLAGIGWAWALWVRSDYLTQVDVVRDQPVPFSHDHHVSGLGIDCRYCHVSVERSAFAGIPSTEICMGCHAHVWKDSPLLEPVRVSYREQKPLAWNRVHDLPDFVYFDHSIHVARGVACERCHGRVDRMPLMRKAFSLHMEWCLECHRHPEIATGAREDVFRFGRRSAAQDSPDEASTGSTFPAAVANAAPPAAVHKDDALNANAQKITAQRGDVHGINKSQLTDCSICHR